MSLKGTWWWKKNLGGRKKYSLAKNIYLPTLTKPVKFGQTLPVYFTACSGSYSFVCSQWSGPMSFILNLDSNKERSVYLH